MKIKSLQLKNFKRFTDLTLQGIPENAKLVLLIGSNGSGKSSVFDAFEAVSSTLKKETGYNSFDKYFKNKKTGTFVSVELSNDLKIERSNDTFKGTENFTSSSFYGRSSFRQIPRLTRRSLGENGMDIKFDSDRPRMYIDRDERFENDLENIFGRLLKEFFRTGDEKSEIKEKIVNPINESLERIFAKENGTKLRLLELIPPLEGKFAEINFQKGDSIFHYNYLSAGEKEVFTILINLVARREYYQDTIYFFDEIDLHLNTRLQYNFLKEVTENWIPANCQLWTASHSLGFIQYAKENKESVIFDFDDYDFDYPKVLTPEVKDNPRLYNIAVDEDILPSLFKGFRIVFVENTDKQYYAALNIASTIFIPENGRNSVYHKTKEGQYYGIVDRDFLTDDDIAQIEGNYKNLAVLRYYSVENYLYHPDNLEEYYLGVNRPFDKQSYIKGLINTKNAIKDQLIPNISLKRTEYPYFGEPEFNGKEHQNRFKNKGENMQQSTTIAGYLNSDELEAFYKVMPMKSYATHLPERQNIPKTELSKTHWFKTQIESIIK